MSKAFQFKITLAMEEFDIWRRIIVPADITFNQFHFILQNSFNWLSYHLFDFRVFGDGEEGEEVAFVGEEDDVYDDGSEEDDIKTFPFDTPLSKFVPEFSRILYSYDYGDGWLHYCEFEKTLDVNPSPYPVCTEGAGDAPPDDVGSEGGFADFLSSINDKKHPDHDEMTEWGKGQEFTRFDLDKINKKLMRSLKRKR
ncbi:MAG: plasmid pRiA4b ORF-3 family protein [Eubacteriales bacterium]